jgi:hypothetical protein
MTSDEHQNQAADDATDASAAEVDPDRSPEVSPDGIREDMVQKLLKGFDENEGVAAVGDFIGVEFHKERDRPTQEERDEAHRRYVDELAAKGLPESNDER